MGIFTFCQGYCVAFTACVYDPKVVAIAAFTTAGVVAGLTIYAWTTKTDFTVMGGLLAVVISSFLLVSLFAMFFMDVFTMFFLMLGTILFGLYIIIDTQMIIGEQRYEINDEDYILGALVLYIDIIQLFLYILRILGDKK